MCLHTEAPKCRLTEIVKVAREIPTAVISESNDDWPRHMRHDVCEQKAVILSNAH